MDCRTLNTARISSACQDGRSSCHPVLSKDHVRVARLSRGQVMNVERLNLHVIMQMNLFMCDICWRKAVQFHTLELAIQRSATNDPNLFITPEA